MHIVAYGSSITFAGRYLEQLLPLLRATGSTCAFELTRVGLWGFGSSWAAYRIGSDVLPLAPDLVIVEFAVNDMGSPDEVAGALHGMVAQIRAARPQCEFVFVSFAPGGVRGPSSTIDAHEAVAEYYGFPSINMSEVAEDLVVRGAAEWQGNSKRALTSDGFHQNAIAAVLLGIPFAEAITSLASEPVPARAEVPAPPSLFARARCIPLQGYARGSGWIVRQPWADDGLPGAYSTAVYEALTAGARFQFEFDGSLLMLWLLKTAGELDVTIDGISQHVLVPRREAMGPPWHALQSSLPNTHHRIGITAVALPVVLGDIFLVGERAG